MAYMDKEHAARIRNRLKEALPAKDGWRFKCAISSGKLGIEVTLMQGPVALMAYQYDSRSMDPEMPATAAQARAAGRTVEVNCGGVNHYWYAEHYTPETVDALRKMIDATMAEHWDKSDSMTDYFNCAFYPHFGIGEWDKPYKVSGR
jgi:hypothetical protein